MRWYVRVNRETIGPVDGEVVVGWVREGRLGPAAKIAVEGADSWTSIAESPFANEPAAFQPAKKRWSTPKIALIVAGAVLAVTMGTCGACVAIGAKSVSDATSDIKTAERRGTGDRAPLAVAETVATAREAEAPTAVPLNKLLSEYKDNEVRADQQFKGRLIVTSGKVGDVKKDFLNHIYITVGNGGFLEIPMVQCFPASGQESEAAALSKGDLVTIRGRVYGLMMNVLIKECELGGS